MVDPQRRAPAQPASLLRAGLAARALGVRLHRAVDHRVPGLHGHPDDRDARVHVHQHQPGPGGAAAVRRAEELRDAAQATSRSGSRSGSRSSSPRSALPVAVILPFARRAAAPLPPPASARACSGSCSSCPTSCRSWPACSSGAGCSTRSTGWINAGPAGASASRTRRPGSRTRAGSTPGLVLIGRLGDRRRDDRLPRRAQGHPDRPVRGGPDRRRRAPGRRSATSRSR